MADMKYLLWVVEDQIDTVERGLDDLETELMLKRIDCDGDKKWREKFASPELYQRFMDNSQFNIVAILDERIKDNKKKIQILEEKIKKKTIELENLRNYQKHYKKRISEDEL